MIIAKLINPQIIFLNGSKVSFNNDLILIQDGVEIERRPINLPYDMPDAEIEAWAKQQALNKATQLSQTQSEQETLEWDWPEFDMGVI